MKRKHPLASLTVGLLAVVLFGLWQVSRSRTFQFFGDLVYRIETDRKVVALTFDDGPNPEGTTRVLAILDSLQATGTFFLTGQELREHPEEGRAIVLAGHELGNHSYSHGRMIGKSPQFIRQELERTDSLIKAAGQAGEIFFRPPYSKKLFVLPWVLARTDRTTVTCDVEPESYLGAWQDSRAITEYALEDVRPGSIVLLHVMYLSREASLTALPQIITGLRARGFEFVTFRELLQEHRRRI
jgi:peptidoglycan/xylan/chitin deacetylase (PgdA/CDA1 family)